VLNGIAQVLFDGTVPSCVNCNSIHLTSQLGTWTERVLWTTKPQVTNGALYKTNSVSKGRSRNAIYFKTVCHGGVFVSTGRRAAPPNAGKLAVACTARKFAISHLSDT